LPKQAQENKWTPELTQQYERMDEFITQAMLMAEKQVSKKVSKTYQWSPTLSSSIHTLTYWKLRLAQHNGKTISTNTL